MDKWKGKVAIVTGASAGIGAAVAEALVKEGLKVAALARRKEKLDALAKRLKGKPGTLYPIKADVSKEADILEAFTWIKANLGPIHILINNAGIGRCTSLIDGDTNMWREILDTNLLGLCVATREAVRDMRSNDVNGHIVHMNSIFGHHVAPHPEINVYPATKFGITALTETLRQELNSVGSKIKITSISPGLVATEIREAGGYTSEEFKKAFESCPELQPEDVADAVVYVLSTPPHVQVHELTIKSVGELF